MGRGGERGRTEAHLGAVAEVGRGVNAEGNEQRRGNHPGLTSPLTEHACHHPN